MKSLIFENLRLSKFLAKGLPKSAITTVFERKYGEVLKLLLYGARLSLAKDREDTIAGDSMKIVFECLSDIQTKPTPFSYTIAKKNVVI